MLPLVSDRAEWVSLQKEVRRTDVHLLASHTEIRHFGDELKDFADTAALVELMDLVVTVDTSVAHLAGAMGKAVWILLPFSPDWRWLLDREDSVWYPTARLFRQPAIGDWASVIDSVGAELASVIAGASERNRRSMISAAFTTDDGYNHYSGLANCIFRMAAVISLAIDNRDEYEFPRWSYAAHYPRLSHAWRDSYEKEDYPIVFKESSFPTRASLHSELPIFGVFSFREVFQAHLQEIQRLFRLSDLTVDACGVHVRRGDYLKYPAIFPVLPLEYYAQPSIMRCGIGMKRFVVCTDDPAWVRSHFLPRFPSHDIELSTGSDAVHDLTRLGECRWLITANSTFSVMAGILAGHGRCISPRTWFRPNSGRDSRDITPESWIKI